MGTPQQPNDAQNTNSSPESGFVYPPPSPVKPVAETYEAAQNAPAVVSGTPAPASYPPPHGIQAQVDPYPSPAQSIGIPWTTGLFDCHEHQTNAVMTAFFPCVTFGQIAEILDAGQTSCSLGSVEYILMAPALCTCWILGSNYRARLRKRYNLVEAPYEDWTAHLFCPCCSLCQEFRELKNRGIDPSLGWMGNLALQQNKNTTTVPPQGQFMSM